MPLLCDFVLGNVLLPYKRYGFQYFILFSDSAFRMLTWCFLYYMKWYVIVLKVFSTHTNKKIIIMPQAVIVLCCCILHDNASAVKHLKKNKKKTGEIYQIPVRSATRRAMGSDPIGILAFPGPWLLAGDGDHLSSASVVGFPNFGFRLSA
jgi:hypothetical protein